MRPSLRLLLLLVWMQLAAAPAADPPRAELDLGDDGALSVKLQGATLLDGALPQLYRFLHLHDGALQQPPDYQWMTTAKREYDAETHHLRCLHEWGGFQIAYSGRRNQVDMAITFLNTTDRPLQQLRLLLSPPVTFPQVPQGRAWAEGWDQLSSAFEPPVGLADWGAAALAVTVTDPDADLRVGFTQKGRITLEVGEVPAGKRRRVNLSLRFGAGNTDGDPLALVADVLQAYSQRHPRTVHWPDRRPIAALHPASAHLGAGSAGATTNPRGWIIGNDAQPVDITTDAGRAAFREAMLQWARNSVPICQDMNAQGVINWCLEGQEYPHAISYLGSPDMLPEMAPEMDAVADAWFAVFRDAGLRTGVCIRPQQLVRNPDHDPNAPPENAPYAYRQVDLFTPDGAVDYPAVTALLDRKISYANKRWGCTLFYVDTNVSSHWEIDADTGKPKQTFHELLHPQVFAELARRHPDCLIIPEHENTQYWSVSVPLGETPKMIQAIWPKAFSMNLMQHFNPDDPAQVTALEDLVRRGDILLFHGWYRAKANTVIKGIYERAHDPEMHEPAN